MSVGSQKLAVMAVSTAGCTQGELLWKEQSGFEVIPRKDVNMELLSHSCSLGQQLAALPPIRAEWDVQQKPGLQSLPPVCEK